MMLEINFDGIVGPSHNYAGLSPGNLAASANAGRASFPRAAALEGIAKMRANLALGLCQGVFLPHARPDHAWLTSLATDAQTAPAWLRAAALSASPMWAANAATISPAPDTADGRCHLTVANLVTMPHRSHEWPQTLAQLRLAFAHPAMKVRPTICACHRRLRLRGSRFSSMVLVVAAFPSGSMRRPGASLHARTDWIRRGPCTSPSPKPRSQPAPSITMWSRSPME
jgi:succinylarginine dihydrolase